MLKKSDLIIFSKNSNLNTIQGKKISSYSALEAFTSKDSYPLVLKPHQEN